MQTTFGLKLTIDGGSKRILRLFNCAVYPGLSNSKTSAEQYRLTRSAARLKVIFVTNGATTLLLEGPRPLNESKITRL
jgi:hypothetical protein